MSIIANCWVSFQSSLFSDLCPCMSDRLTARHWKLLDIFEVVRVHRHISDGQWMGRRRIDRTSIARAFVAKAVYGLPTTELLIELLHAQPTLRKICGFETRRQIPSPATFSRAFAEFSATELPTKVHEALIIEFQSERLVGHIAREYRLDGNRRAGKSEVQAQNRQGTHAAPQTWSSEKGRRTPSQRTDRHQQTA